MQIFRHSTVVYMNTRTDPMSRPILRTPFIPAHDKTIQFFKVSQCKQYKKCSWVANQVKSILFGKIPKFSMATTLAIFVRVLWHYIVNTNASKMIKMIISDNISIINSMLASLLFQDEKLISHWPTLAFRFLLENLCEATKKVTNNNLCQMFEEHWDFALGQAVLNGEVPIRHISSVTLKFLPCAAWA